MSNKMFKNAAHKIAATALMLASVATPASAALRVCLMKPTQVTTNNVGDVFLHGTVGLNGQTGATPLQLQMICNVKSDTNGVFTDVCKNWFSTALTAQSTGKTLFMYYYDDVHNYNKANCSEWPHWSSLVITYLGVQN
jgi:hypothetical protein